MFQMAELEASRAGKIGMQVGSLREGILVALLIYKFGEKNVESNIPITEPEVDVKLFGEPVSVKTITGKSFSGVKLVWTVDQDRASQFCDNYVPSCDMLLARIQWGGEGGLFYIPVETQARVLQRIGRKRYLKMPKPGTNPRGAEITADALSTLVSDPNARGLTIVWQKTPINYDPLKRWIDLWRED